MRTQTTDDQDTLRFRAPTLEEAVALAEQSLGTRVRVLAANRIRRGGIGGFFASDLGIEVIVTPEAETVEDALERLINDSANDDRFQWNADRGVPGAMADAGGSPATDGSLDMPGRRWLLEQTSALPAATAQAIQDALAEGGSHAERRARRRQPVDIDPSDPATNISSWWEPPEADRVTASSTSPAMRSDGGDAAATFDDIVAQIDRDERAERAERAEREVDVIDVLTALAGSRADTHRAHAATNVEPTAATAVSSESFLVGPTLSGTPTHTGTVESPGLIRVEKIIEELQALTASPRLLTVMKQRQAQEAAAEAAAEAARSRQALLGTPRHHPVEAERSAASTVATRPVAEAPSTQSVDIAVDLVAEVADPTGEIVLDGAHTGPSQRQVELAVAAADQLIDSLSRESDVRRVSVRIVLRTAGQDEVEAGAEWESKA